MYFKFHNIWNFSASLLLYSKFHNVVNFPYIYIYIIFSSLHSKSRKRPKAGSFSKLPNAWILANLFLNIAVLLNENKNNGECWSVKYKK